MFKRTKTWLLCMLMAVTAVTPVSAAELTEQPADTEAEEESGLTVDLDGSEGDSILMEDDRLQAVMDNVTGTITVTLTDGKEGTSKSGVEFSCDKIADITGGEYVLTEQYQASGVDLNSIANASDMETAAQKLAETVQPSGLTATTSEDGTLVFQDLEVGVYLLSATNDDNYDEVTPALVAIPTWSEETGDMVYDINVTPKHTERPDEPVKEPEASENPGTTNGAPQTNAYSPVLLYFGGAAAIVVILVIANFLFRKKR